MLGFASEHTDEGATVYTDDSGAYKSLPFDHESVRHSVSEYVRGHGLHQRDRVLLERPEARSQGRLPQDQHKHLNRYVQEFAAKHNMRESDTVAQMWEVVARMIGRRLLYRDLIADNSLSERGEVARA